MFYFISYLPLFSKIVLVAVQDSATKYGSAPILIGALKRLGAREPIVLEHRSSFALAGFAGSMFPSWVSQAQNKHYKGPSVLLVTIEGGYYIVSLVFFNKSSVLIVSRFLYVSLTSFLSRYCMSQAELNFPKIEI